MPGTPLTKVQDLNTYEAGIEHGFFEEEVEDDDVHQIELEEIGRNPEDRHILNHDVKGAINLDELKMDCNMNNDYNDLVIDALVHHDGAHLIES